MNKQTRLAVATEVSPASVAAVTYTYEHVGLDDYVSRACVECEGVGEVEILALDAVRPVIIDCDECGGSGVGKPHCDCGTPVTGGAPDGDNGVCHSCELVFHRDEPDEPEDVRVQFAKIFGTPEGWSRVEL